jgi:signal transduction histidine kinase
VRNPWSLGAVRATAARGLGSVRVRTTVLATVAFAVALTAGSYWLVGAVRGSLEDRVRQDNLLYVQRAADQLRSGIPPADVSVQNGAGVQIIRDDGTVVAGSSGLEYQRPIVTIVGDATPIGPVTLPAIKGTSQIVGSESVATPAGNKFTVAVASPLDGVRRSVDTVVRYLKIGIPLAVLLLGALVWLLVRRALRPVEAIREEVEEISHGTLHRRVPVSSAHDEVARLAGTMNAMLDRLECSAQRQRTFVSDASHELRSPLAATRTLLEVTGNGDAHDAVDWDALRDGLVAENSRMAQLVDGLLELARADDADALGSTQPVELADVVAEETSRRRSVEVRIGDIPNVTVHGNADQLGRALRNVLDNAARYAHARVEVSVITDGGEVELRVDDDGPGVPAADRTRVFERFTRLEEGRTRSEGGAGLGLAIVAAIAGRHHGDVRVDDSPLGGARFVLRLPVVTPVGPRGSGS